MGVDHHRLLLCVFFCYYYYYTVYTRKKKKNPEHFCFFLCMKWTGFWTVDRPLFHFNEHNSRLVDFLYPQQQQQRVLTGGFWNSLLLATMNVLTVRSLFAPCSVVHYCIPGYMYSINSICCTTWIIAFFFPNMNGKFHHKLPTNCLYTTKWI